MTTQQFEPLKSATPIKRRGVFALGAALVAGLVAKLTEQPVSAGTDGDVILGANGVANLAPTPTSICNNGSAAGPTISALRSPGAVSAQTLAINAAILAQCAIDNETAVWGRSQNGAQAKGVRGISFAGTGVFGEGHTGVHGESENNIGVEGVVPATSSSNAIAVYGLNTSAYAGPGPGAGGFGVYGLSAKGHGLVGATATAGAAAVVGATNGVADAYAAAFYGPVIIGGALTVVGGPKSAAVPHPDGSHRRLYCVESPESWFEDFGKGQLECGRAEVPIDPDFAAVVSLDDYHVFLTQYGGHDDLSVSEQTTTGFCVEARDATSSCRFSWRIVAKRQDISGPRLETVAIPPEPTLPPVPDDPMPAPPPALHLRGR
jgi:hypothetical protein